MAKEKLVAGTITKEEYEIILPRTAFRRLSDAADKGMYLGENGEVIDNVSASRGADALASADRSRSTLPSGPIDPHNLASTPCLYRALAKRGFLSLSNDGYAILRPLDFAVPCVIVHADQRKKNAPLREGDVVYLRWNSAWL